MNNIHNIATGIYMRELKEEPVRLPYMRQLQIIIDVYDQAGKISRRYLEAQEQLRILYAITPENKAAYEFVRRCEQDDTDGMRRLLAALTEPDASRDTLEAGLDDAGFGSAGPL